MRVIVLTATLLLTGCGTVAKSSGPLPVGPDTYRILARGAVANLAKSQEMAFTEASGHCLSMSKRLMTTNTEDAGNNGFVLTYRCLNEGDPDLVRPVLRSVPSSVIRLE
jgi:uncharacterized protein YceK